MTGSCACGLPMEARHYPVPVWRCAHCDRPCHGNADTCNRCQTLNRKVRPV